jgi:hypothetical protein
MLLALALSVLSLRAAPIGGGLVETKDGKTYAGRVQLVDGPSLRIQVGDGSTKELPLAQVRLARMGTRDTSMADLPSGWFVEDTGQGQSRSSGRDDQFQLRATAEPPREPKQAPLHCVYRVLRGDGDIVARLQEVAGPPSSLAGVMMHENLEVMGGCVLLGVSPDKHLRLRSRENGWSALTDRDLGTITLPIWLKLSRQEKDRQVRFLKSTDGRNWQALGQVGLGCRVEPWPEGSDNWRPKVHLGLAVANTNAPSEATARMEQTTITARGLLGEYFADSGFRSIVFSRPDDRMEFWWGESSPGPDIPEDHFGVRWTGRVQPRFSESYRFQMEADNDARLWLNGQELPTGMFKKDDKGKQVPLVAGQWYDLKIEFKEGAGAASFRLGWSSRSQALEVIPASQLSCVLRGPLLPAEPGTAPDGADPLPQKGVRLIHGSFLAGKVFSMNDGMARVTFARQQDFPIARSKIAEIRFLTSKNAIGSSPSRELPGVVLKTGSYLECEVTSLTENTLSVRSTLLGARSYNPQNGEVAAVLLRDRKPLPAAYELRLAGGSILRASGLEPASNLLQVEDTTLGRIQVPLSLLREIRSPAPDLVAGR